MPIEETTYRTPRRTEILLTVQGLSPEQALRLACLDRAIQNSVRGCARTADLVKEASSFFDFVNDTNDAEIIRAAHEFAKKLGA